MNEPAYTSRYVAKVVSVFDGDTFRADVEIWYGIAALDQPFQLARINAPELRGEQKAAGRAARNRLRELVLGKKVFIERRKKERGRSVVELYLTDGRCVNDLLVEEGHAIYKRSI